MGRLKQRAARRIRSLLLGRGFRLERLTEQERRDLTPRGTPEGLAPRRLAADNPRLLELRAAYTACDLPAAASSVWSQDEVDRDVDLARFRGDNLYVWQQRQLGAHARMKQYLALRDVSARDDLALLDRLEEDGAFGALTFVYGSRGPVSRDLVDAVNELNFLELHLRLSDREQLRILDIGAGYGRLAHAAAAAFDNLVTYDCLDAIAESTFLCEFYLEYRGITDRCRAVPLTQVEELEGPYDVAVNIHSFSEMPETAVAWWLDQVVRLEVPALLVVPNDGSQLLSYEADGTRRDLFPLLDRAGFSLQVDEPVLAEEEVRELVGVQDRLLLLTRT